jgi:hypothetical protein
MRNQKLADLLHQYFELGVEEGREGRKHDTEAGDAQRVLSEIEAEIATLSAAEPVKTYGYVYESTVRYFDGRGPQRKVDFSYTKKNISDDDIEEFEISETAVYDRPPHPAPSVAVKATIEQCATHVEEMFDDDGFPLPNSTKIANGIRALSAQVQDDEETKVAIALGASVLSKIADPAAREVAIRNALTAASISAAQVQDVAGTVEAFDRDHPELYWHIAKGKITAGEPLYGAIITDIRGNELGDGESNVSAVDAFNIAVDDAAIAAAPAKQEGGSL